MIWKAPFGAFQRFGGALERGQILTGSLSLIVLFDSALRYNFSRH